MSNCRLCQCDDKPLKSSHIVSKMFFNAIKKQSLTKIMRQVSDPNKGVQDGLKTDFLCERCEQLFSKYETYFSNSIFLKTVDNDGDFEFDSSDVKLSYFLLSIAWRIVKYVRENDDTTFTEKEKKELDQTIEKWRVLLDSEKLNEIRKIQQFIIPTKKLKFFQSTEMRITDNVMIDFKTFDKEDTFKYAFTIVQVPYFIFITTVWGKTDTMKRFRLGKRIKPYECDLPQVINSVLYNNHYNNYLEACNKLSDKQKKGIEERVKKALISNSK